MRRQRPAVFLVFALLLSVYCATCSTAEPPLPEPTAQVTLEAFLGESAVPEKQRSADSDLLPFQVHTGRAATAGDFSSPLAVGRAGGTPVAVPPGLIALVIKLHPLEIVGPFQAPAGIQTTVRFLAFPQATPPVRTWRVERGEEAIARAFPPPVSLPPPAPETQPSGLQDPVPPSPLSAFSVSSHEVLSRAFENFYGCDLAQRILLRVHTPDGQVLEYASQQARAQRAGRTYQMTVVEGRSDLRDYRVLTIQNRGRSDDTFVYVPSLLRARRFTAAQRADRFLGTDLALEDLEIHDADRFEIVGRSVSSVAGEPAHLVTAQPLYQGSSYDRADFFVAQHDYALLEVHFYRKQALRAFKITRSAREDMERLNGHVLPRRMVFSDLERGTRTEVIFHARVVNPDLDLGLFTKTTLESRRSLLRPRSEAELNAGQ